MSRWSQRVSTYTLEQVRADPGLLYQMSADEQTPELCLAAVTTRGCVLKFVKRQTDAICQAAVQNDPWALQFVAPVFQTPNLCLAAVCADGMVLGEVKRPSAEICWAAVTNDGRALEFVPESSPELCLKAVQTHWQALKFINTQTVEMAQVAVRQTGYALRHVFLPRDRLLEPASHQLQAWCDVLTASQRPSLNLALNAKLSNLIEDIPLGKQYHDEWQQPAGEGRMMLDLLVDLANEMVRLTDTPKILAFSHRVNRQVELTMSASIQSNEPANLNERTDSPL